MAQKSGGLFDAFGAQQAAGLLGDWSSPVANALSAPAHALSGLFAGYVPPPAQANALATQQANDAGYQAWKQQYGLTETPDYDLRGAYASGLKPDQRGHLDDTFKLPNHITFSTDSRYSTPQEKGGVWAQGGNGKWTFTPGPANMKRYSAQQLQDYFRQYEPDSTLILPR